jgi:hypothetical protein
MGTYRLERLEKTSRPPVPARVLDDLTEIGTAVNKVGVMGDRNPEEMLQTTGR